ncbi:MAG: TIM barrel protein [Mariniphaga sp.]
MNRNRRDFLKTTSATAAGVVLTPALFAGSNNSKPLAAPICVFTKCLQFLDYDKVGETLAKAGFDGAELSVRSGGQVLPENVKVDLPKAIKAIQKSGISVPMMVTGITDAEDPISENILATAANLGVKYYRMGYLKYDKELNIIANLDAHKRNIDKLEKLNRKTGIKGVYQNHSGTNIGGPVWDLYWLLKDFDPKFIGVQYDIRHAVAEGGVSWPIGMELLAPWIDSTPIKDFYWKKENSKWEIMNVPLGEGMVDFDAFLNEYKRLKINGPFTLHFEYDLGGAESGKTNPKMELDQILTYMKGDLGWFKKKLIESGL